MPDVFNRTDISIHYRGYILSPLKDGFKVLRPTGEVVKSITLVKKLYFNQVLDLFEDAVREDIKENY